MTANQIVIYGFSRLCFLREKIEPLRMDDVFQINCPFGSFRMTKRDFLNDFGHIIETKSWKKNGIYHYPHPPRKALKYLVEEQTGRPVQKTSKRYKYHLPDCLEGKCTKEKYLHWLQRKAMAHCRRDKKRGNATTSYLGYKFAIHQAVMDGGDKDAYTGKPLDWSLISTYSNVHSKGRGRDYKKRFANLPTVDHVGNGLGSPDFKICSWRVNDCKSDLTMEEFLAVCKDVIKYAGYKNATSL